MTAPSPDPTRILDELGHAVIVSEGGRITTWNPGAVALYGWTADEAMGRHLFDLTALSSAAEENAEIMETVRAGDTWSGDYACRRKDGSIVLVHASVAAMRGEDGSIEAIVSVSHDVSGRRSREETLQQDEERLRAAFQSARMGAWTWDLETGLVEWDEHMAARYGLAPGEFEGSFEAFVARIHPDDRESVIEKITDARDREQDLMFEHRVVWPDGSVHWLEARGQPARDDDGQFLGMVGVGIDIDERKQLEALILEATELRATAKLAADLQEAERIAHLGSWRWEAGPNVVTLSLQMARLLGTDRTLTGNEFAEALRRVAHSDDRDRIDSSATEALGGRRSRYVMECRFVVDGDVRQMVHRGEILYADDGETLVAVRGTFQDITEQRRGEEALAAARERLAMERHAVEVLHDTLIRPAFPALAGFELGARYVAAENDSEIGGDWYDAFKLPDGRLMVAVGDVSGHGVGAARLMAKLRHATRAYACIDDDLLTLLVRLDAFLLQFADDGQIATMLVVQLDPATGKFHVASAGHLPPLLVAGDVSEFLDVCSLPVLGALDNAETVPSFQSQLEPGHALLLYTDGLVERRSESLDRGLERLMDRMRTCGDESAGALCDAAIEASLAGHERHDDVCLLALRRLGSD